GVLAYRGIDIHALAERSTFEEVAFLLHRGVLPTRAQLQAFRAELARQRALADGLVSVVRGLPKDTHPMTALRTTVSAAGAFDSEAEDDSESARMHKSMRLIAQMGSMVAAFERLRGGRTPVAPDPALSHAANFLYMLT